MKDKNEKGKDKTVVCFFQTIYSHEKETEVSAEMDKLILKFLQNWEGFRNGKKKNVNKEVGRLILSDCTTY